MANGNMEQLETLFVGTENNDYFETRYNEALAKAMGDFDLERQRDSSNAEADYNVAVLGLSSTFPMIPNDLTNKKVRIFPKEGLNGFFYGIILYGDGIEILDYFCENGESPKYGSSIYRIEKIRDFWEMTRLRKRIEGGLMIANDVHENEIVGKVKEVCANSNNYGVVVDDVDN